MLLQELGHRTTSIVSLGGDHVHAGAEFLLQHAGTVNPLRMLSRPGMEETKLLHSARSGSDWRSIALEEHQHGIVKELQLGVSIWNGFQRRFQPSFTPSRMASVRSSSRQPQTGEQNARNDSLVDDLRVDYSLVDSWQQGIDEKDGWWAVGTFSRRISRNLNDFA